VPSTPTEAEVLAGLVAWGESDEEIRALVLTSGRARRDGTADELSDYDLIVAVRDAPRFVEDAAWTGARGRALVSWGDEHELYGESAVFRGAVYADAVKVDFTIWPETLLAHVAEAETLPDALDVGYTILLDKDGATSRWGPPTYRAHVPTPPTRAEYEALVDEFWWDTTYAAKALRRGEVVFAKFVLDHDVKQGALRRMLEWRIELDHGWTLRPGAYGRGLERLLPADLAAQLLGTYVGAGVEENWDALFRTTALFRTVTVEVAEALGFRYPQEVDEAITAQLEAARERESPPS
jgi:aminoglycoside 6-adenylyltransferase